MSAISSWLRSVVDTVWLSLVRPKAGPVLPAPGPAYLQVQPANTNWCGPADVVTLTRLLAPPGVDLADAVRALVGTGGPVDASVVAGYLGRHGCNAAFLPTPGASVVAVMTQALAGGAYCLLSLQYGGAGHYVIVYGVQGGNVLVADSILRSAGHYYTIPCADIPARCGRTLADLIIVRRA